MATGEKVRTGSCVMVERRERCRGERWGGDEGGWEQGGG